MNRSIRTPLLLLGISELAVLFVSVYLAGYIVFGSIDIPKDMLAPLWVRALTVAVVVFSGLIAVGLYQFHQRSNYREVFVRVSVAVFASALVLAAAFYLIPTIALPFRMVTAAFLVSLLFLLLIRLGFVRSVDENIFRRRVLVFGAGERAGALSDLRRRADRRGFKVVSRICAPGDTLGTERDQLRDHSKALLEIADELDIDEIVIAMDDRRGNLPVRELLDCKLRGVEVTELSDFLERETGMIRIDLVNPGWLIFTPGFHVGQFRQLSQRAMDLLVATLVLLIGFPVLLIVAACIKIADGLSAPVIYRQQRVGLHGETFDVLKFRSMRVDAEKDGEAVWAAEDDDRITPIGSVIRKFRIDELPQVFNVLKGEMSLVGPRPERPEFVSMLSERIPFYDERHTVKPGVTGWAQLRYSYGSSEEDAARKLQYDLYYIKNQSLMLDLLIILQTVEVVLWGKGAR